MLHHSATWDDKQIKDFDAIRAGHIRIGDRDIGYHWLIEYANGQLSAYRGRQESDSAAACPGYNFNAIHICLVGNFEESIPTEEEYRAIVVLCKDIMTRWPITEICGHRDKYPTACPGANFDVDYVRELAKGENEVLADIKVIVKGQEITGKVINNVTYVPVRELIEVLNNRVGYDAVDKVVTIK
jgi:N-acetyl-anhydromuramyl-L-alanine amidase AmpD